MRRGVHHGVVTFEDVKAITPETAERYADSVRDSDLPMLAAHWLADGYDSDALRDLAGLTARDGAEARVLLPEVLSSLGHPAVVIENHYDEAPWRGYWGRIAWAQQVMDGLMSPYAAAQVVLEVAGDVDGLWAPAGGDKLMALLAEWDQNPDDRQAIDERIRAQVQALREGDVPALLDAPPS